ncbi:hypothetical protein LCGC14_1339330 [marine sediment metagenome]|uniref:Uncharacterized protein n=1 Tax=marine sediment metagenome TaxID=412755 RepID=A0A0F9NGD8_9ZZZZ
MRKVRPPKTFRVREIITLADGRIILNGDHGSLDLRRHDDRHSSAMYHPIRFGTQPTRDRQADDLEHVVTIAEIPRGGSIAF